MTREELARETATRTGLTMKEVQTVLVTILEVIQETLCRGESVFLRGFGCFRRKGQEKEGPRPQGRRPHGDPLQTPAGFSGLSRAEGFGTGGPCPENKGCLLLHRLPRGGKGLRGGGFQRLEP